MAGGFETHVPTRLTTPVPYMTSLPTEPFKEHVILDENPQYNYNERNYFILPGTEADYDTYIAILVGSFQSVIKYNLLSHGPDLDHDDLDSGTTALYDPTNGTTSNGDITYWGSGAGLKN